MKRQLIAALAVGALAYACGGTTGDTTDAGLDAGNDDVTTIKDSGLVCNAPSVACSGACVNTSFDPGNCGACGNACASGTQCVSGKCAASQTLCTQDGGAPYYANLQTDNANCGACGKACSQPGTCSQGHCCAGSDLYCGSACTNVASDNQNCGACGKACSAGQSCIGSTCLAYPKSCADLLVSQGVLPDGGPLPDGGLADGGSYQDGNYVIDPDGAGPIKPFTVFCAGMATTTPKEYLTLAHSYATNEPTSNFTMTASGGACGTTCANTYRQWTRVRLLVPSLQIDPTDMSFAFPRNASLNTCWNGLGGACGAEWKSQPYGTAWDCAANGSATGQANIDLRDTGFSIDASVTFTPNGFNPGGTATFANSRETVDVTGGGFCGGNGASSPFQLDQL